MADYYKGLGEDNNYSFLIVYLSKAQCHIVLQTGLEVSDHLLQYKKAAVVANACIISVNNVLFSRSKLNDCVAVLT